MSCSCVLQIFAHTLSYKQHVYTIHCNTCQDSGSLSSAADVSDSAVFCLFGGLGLGLELLGQIVGLEAGVLVTLLYLVPLLGLFDELLLLV